MKGTTTERRLQFERWVQQAEAQIAAAPATYKWRVALLAVLGYVVIFGLLAILIGLIAGSIWGALSSTVFLILLIKKKLIFLLGFLVYSIGRALWVKLDPPVGYALKIARVPALQQEIQALQQALRTPRIHEIILTDEFNAGIAQTPRLGIFGWDKNTLILGLPLLLALSPLQARAVLAHEFGHISGNHSRFNGWIYRVRMSWYRVMQAFDHSGAWGMGWLRRLFNWYAPYFSAYSFALARANEYEADAISAQMTSPQAAAQALLRTNVLTPVSYEHYWNPLIARADKIAEPARSPIGGLAKFLHAPNVVQEAMGEQLAKLQRVETGHDDTHPALKDRLQALGASPELPLTLEESAAQAWFGSEAAALLQDFDQQWLNRNEAAWKERFAQAEAGRHKIAELRARALDDLSADEHWQLASSTERYGPDVDVLPDYQSYRARFPEHRDADYVIGRLLLARDDATGLGFLEQATEKFSLVAGACEIACGYLKRTGQTELAEQWRLRAERHMDLEYAAHHERQTVIAEDQLTPCTLSEDDLATLRDKLGALSGLKRVWICQKEVEHLLAHPVYVVAFEVAGWRKKEQAWFKTMGEALAWPDDTFFVMQGGPAKKLANKVIGVGTQLR